MASQREEEAPVAYSNLLEADCLVGCRNWQTTWGQHPTRRHLHTRCRENLKYRLASCLIKVTEWLNHQVSVQILTAAGVNTTAFWDNAPCSSAVTDRCFRCVYCHHYKVIALIMKAVSTSETSMHSCETIRRNIPEGCHIWLNSALVIVLVMWCRMTFEDDNELLVCKELEWEPWLMSRYYLTISL